MDWNRKLKELQRPFNYSDVKWRVGKVNKKDSTAIVFAYVSNRAIQNRFDDVFGINGWKNEFKEWHNDKIALDLPSLAEYSKASTYSTKEEVAVAYYKDYMSQSQLCGISVWDEDKREWITKWDGADDTNFEKTKGGISDSQKRAAYQWGVGRYLYDLPSQTVPVDTKYGQSYIKYGCTPELPAWALDDGDLDLMKIGILETKTAKKGLTEDIICGRYFREKFAQLNINQFKEVSKLLDCYKDVKKGEKPVMKDK